MKKTIQNYLFISFFTRFGISFVNATYVSFLLAKGLNLLDVNLVNLTFYTMMFLWEIPTGAIADVFGRRTSYLCSCGFHALGLLIYGISHSFVGFLVAETILAIGFTCASGAFQAWLVDQLHHQGYTEPLTKIFAREQQIAHGTGIVAALIGARLADYNIAYPWFVSALMVTFAGLFTFFTMKEEYFTPQKYSFHEGLRQMRETTTKSIRYATQHKTIRFIMLIGIIQYLAVQAPNMQWQPLYRSTVGSNAALGWLWAGMAMSLVAGSALSGRFIKWIKSEKKALVLTQAMIGLGVAGAVLMKSLPFSLAFFFFHEISRGIWRPLKDVYLNNNIPAKERATIISCESIIHHIGGMIGLLLSGFLAQGSSISLSWSVSGMILIFGTLIVALMVRGR